MRPNRAFVSLIAAGFACSSPKTEPPAEDCPAPATAPASQALAPASAPAAPLPGASFSFVVHAPSPYLVLEQLASDVLGQGKPRLVSREGPGESLVVTSRSVNVA